MGKPIKFQEWPRQVRVGHATVNVYKIKQAGGKTGFTHVVTWLMPFGWHRRKIADEAAAMQAVRLQAGKLNAGRIDATRWEDENCGSNQLSRRLSSRRKVSGSKP